MLTYELGRRGKKTKTIFLYESIKNDILSGKLQPEEKLPSKRELAEHLSVSVLTIENAYVMLEEEGYIYTRPKVGFYVNRLNLPVKEEAASREFEYLEEEGTFQTPEEAQTAYFPAMARIIRKLLSERPEILQQKPPHFGCAVLRNAIAGFLRRYRNMDVSPSHIIIGSGAEYLYGVIAQLFGQDCLFGIEDPSYEKIRLVYEANGVRTDLLKMGESGIEQSELDRTAAHVLHITPYHSYPTGVTASARKRFAYLAWANKKGGYIVEDDFDSEFAFFRKPIDTLYAMDHSGKVVYMNTFTKSLSPAIRIAYMVLSDELLEKYRKKLGFYSCPVPVLEQYALAEFIESGAFERHLGRIRKKLYKKTEKSEQ